LFKFSLQQIGKDVQYSKMRNLPIHSSERVKLRETKGMSKRRILEGFGRLDLYLNLYLRFLKTLIELYEILKDHIAIQSHFIHF